MFGCKKLFLSRHVTDDRSCTFLPPTSHATMACHVVSKSASSLVFSFFSKKTRKNVIFHFPIYIYI
jgi:hypothetical protein